MASPKRQLASPGAGSPRSRGPGAGSASAAGAGAVTLVRRVNVSGGAEAFGRVVAGKLYDGGQLVLVRPGALTLHSDLIHSLQAATDEPVDHQYWGRFGNNFDFFCSSNGVGFGGGSGGAGVGRGDSRDEQYEVLAVSSDGHFLLIHADALSQSRTVEEFDKIAFFASKKSEVTSVLIAAPGVFLVGTSRGEVFRFRRQGRVLQVDQLPSPLLTAVVGDWLSVLRERAKQTLLPVLQAAWGGGDDAATGGAAAAGQSGTNSSVSDDTQSAVVKLLLVPSSPYVLACGDSATLWSNWDKAASEQRAVWTIDLKAIITKDLTELKLKHAAQKFRRDPNPHAPSSPVSETLAMDEVGHHVELSDRFAFGKLGQQLGRVDLVDFCLLHDDNEASWGTLVVLALLTPPGKLSSNLWMYTFELTSQAQPELGPRTFLTSGVNSQAFASVEPHFRAAASSQARSRSSSAPLPSPPVRAPALYTLLPSWRVYCSWVDSREKLVLAQLDVRGLAALNDALFPVSSEAGGDADDDSAAVHLPPPGIATLNTDMRVCDVAAIATSACTGFSGGDRNRQKLDGLVVLKAAAAGGGGELWQALPPLGATYLRWDASSRPFSPGPGARSASLATRGRAGGAALRDGGQLQALLETLRNDESEIDIGGAVTVGAVRDAIANVSLDAVRHAVEAASLSIVDLNDNELYFNTRPGLQSKLELMQRCRRHTALLEVLAQSGVLSEASIRQIVQLHHESLQAAARLCEAVEQLHIEATRVSSRQAGQGSGVVEARDVVIQAMEDFVAQSYAGDKAQLAAQLVKGGMPLRDIFFARPSYLVGSQGGALTCISRALDKVFPVLARQGAAFGASLALSDLFCASLGGARDAVDKFGEFMELSEGVRELSLLATLEDVRSATLLLLLRLSEAARAEGASWADDDLQQSSANLELLSRLVLSSFAVEARLFGLPAASATATAAAAGARPGAAAGMPLAWQESQHAVKLACAESLLVLRRPGEAFALCVDFHIVEELLAAAEPLLASGPEGESAVADELMRLLVEHGSSEVRALTPAKAVPGLSADAAIRLARAQPAVVGNFTVAEFCFLWVEAHRPDLVPLQLALRLAAPAIFDAYVQRRNQPSVPLVRLQFSWMAAVADLRERQAAAAPAALDLVTETGALLQISERAREAASATDTGLGMAETMAAIAKLSAYAAGKSPSPPPPPQQQQVLDRSAAAARLQLLASHKSLLQSELQRRYCGAVVEAKALPDGQLLALVLGQARDGHVDPAPALSDCLTLVSLADQVAKAQGRALSPDLAAALGDLWIVAVEKCPYLPDLARALGESGEAMPELEKQELLRRSVVGELVRRVWDSQREAATADCDSAELGGVLALGLVPYADSEPPAQLQRLVAWRDVWERSSWRRVAGEAPCMAQVRRLVEALDAEMRAEQ